MVEERVACVIVNDASALIDLKKGRLLHVLGDLPYRWVVPVPIREDEVLSFSGQDWQTLEDSNSFEEFDLPSGLVSEAFDLRMERPKLSANDCFCLVTARSIEKSILLTGDKILRTTAELHKVCVHGILWIVDELERLDCCEKSLLIQALEIWYDDPNVRLPPQEINSRLKLFQD